MDFFGVAARLVERPLAPGIGAGRGGATPEEDLERLVHAAAAGFLEMLVCKRHRIWILHTITGPAAVQWLLPYVAPADARLLVDHAHRSVVAMYLAFGEPYAPLAHLRETADDWSPLIQRAVASRSVHGIKLIDALVRFDRGDDLLMRSVAEQWFAWT